jgi:hypothetical protein
LTDVTSCLLQFDWMRRWWYVSNPGFTLKSYLTFLISIKIFTWVVLDGDTKVCTTESIKRKFETFSAAHPTSNSSSSSAKGPFIYYLSIFFIPHNIFTIFSSTFFSFMYKNFQTTAWKFRQKAMLKNKVFCFNKKNVLMKNLVI